MQGELLLEAANRGKLQLPKSLCWIIRLLPVCGIEHTNRYGSTLQHLQLAYACFRVITMWTYLRGLNEHTLVLLVVEAFWALTDTFLLGVS
jgi:hypothetical protein